MLSYYNRNDIGADAENLIHLSRTLKTVDKTGVLGIEAKVLYLQRILPAIGHIRLDKLQPMHLIEFYNNLSEEGIRSSDTWAIRPALLEKYKTQNNKLTVFAKQAKIGATT